MWRFFCELVLSSTNFFVSSVSSVHCELFPMETSSASTLRKVCPQCSTTVHVRRAVCGCGYAFPSKRRARPDSVSQAILAEGLYFSALVSYCVLYRRFHSCRTQLTNSVHVYNKPTLNLLPTLTRASFLVRPDGDEEEEEEPGEVAVATSGNSCLMKSSLLIATICSRLA